MDLFQMDFFIYILILMLLVGAIMVIYGIISHRGTAIASQSDAAEVPELLSLEKKLDTLETSVYEADEAVHMLGDMSKNVFKEFDSKYQELLFLYNLVDEKQKTLALTDGDEPPSPKQAKAKVSKPKPKPKIAEVVDIARNLDIVIDDSEGEIKPQTQPEAQSQSAGINPKFAHVLELSQNGKSAEEIAKELDMGKGEIMLILNLGGRRHNA